jgi:hypothetical protein
MGEKQNQPFQQGLNKQFTLADLLRQSVYGRLGGLRGPQLR